MKFYWRGIFKFLSVWSERVWVMSVKREAKKWNIRRECERVECERELYGEWSVWSVRVWSVREWSEGVHKPFKLVSQQFLLDM